MELEMDLILVLSHRGYAITQEIGICTPNFGHDAFVENMVSWVMHQSMFRS